MKKKPINVPSVLGAPYCYPNPVPFNRGMCLDFGETNVVLISGTASVNENGESVCIDDLRGQALKTFENITALLNSEEMDWHDVVFTRVYLRDIDRDYAELARVRMEFFQQQGITEYPASTCVEAKLCRPELLVEMEVVAISQKG